MEWYWLLLIIFGCLILLMATGMPVAYAFLIVILFASYFLGRGFTGLEQVITNIKSSFSFTLLPLPLFILMGEVIYHSGIAPKMIDALDHWLGRIPGRLGLIAVGAGTVLSTLTGSTASSVAMLGSTLCPEMERRGYKKSMSLGPILGSGGLAMMIPPSGLAVLLAAIGGISVGDILMAIILPGLLMAVLYAVYTVGRSIIQPEIAPPYDVPHISIAIKLSETVKYILPVGLIIFFVIGLIFLGVATPTEAAATGSLGAFLLAAFYKRINLQMFKKTMRGTLVASVMVLFIIAGATAFSNILAYAGATSGLSRFFTDLPIEPILIIFGFLFVAFFLGMFMGPSAIMMITLPIFVPIVMKLGFNEVWFGALFLLVLEMGQTTPPYGMGLFVMQGVGPPGTTLADCIKAAIPYLVCDFIALVFIIIFPPIALYLPSIMAR